MGVATPPKNPIVYRGIGRARNRGYIEWQNISIRVGITV